VTSEGGDKVVLKTTFPAGTKMAALHKGLDWNVVDESYKGVREWLLDRNSAFRVKRIFREPGLAGMFTTVELELVPEEELNAPAA
jgi:hypothetical protein